MQKQEQEGTSTMKDKLQKPQLELELLQEHIKKEMAQWDHERSSFNHQVYLEQLQVEEKYGHLKNLEKEKADLERNFKALDEEFKYVSLELKKKKNMYTAKEIKQHVDEARNDASKYKRHYDDYKKQAGIKIRETNEEHQREIAGKNQQNQALEEQIR
ncbi:hypothetical protein V6N13_042591 [Hibiscus sabdariffa]|uniref:Uncharacterized protein n=1 Tax=Hibiscus sabdariffa TaxID=183260 RepID=A0ABR2G494_9ROSI